MPNYSLNLSFDDKTLKDIYDAKQQVILIKQTFSTTSNDADIAWVTFNPFETNSVSWEDNYGVYTSTTEIQKGATIRKSSHKTAADTCVYNFDKGFFTKNNDLITEKGSYEVVNETTDKLTFGLTQDVLVNGKPIQSSPLNASTVLAGQNAVFTPFEKVQILLQSNAREGLVLATVSSKVFTAEFGGGVNNISVEYNPTIGQFVLVD